MFSSSLRKSLLGLLLACSVNIAMTSCSGGNCAATNDVLTDFDADCIEDASDNCVIAENPGAGYNPEQFDGDGDGIGVPCDTSDTDATTAGVGLVTDLAFNIAGTYEFSENDCGLTTLTVDQQDGDVVFTFDGEDTFSGTATLSDSLSGTVAARLSDANGTFCQTTQDAVTNIMDLVCTNAQSHSPCHATGVKITTKLWSDADQGDSE